MNYGEIAGLAMPMSRLIMGAGLSMSPDVELRHAGLDQFVALGGNTFDTCLLYTSDAADE